MFSQGENKKMEPLLYVNGLYLCFLTFTIYSSYLYTITSSWNLCLYVILFWFSYFIYDCNHDIIFKMYPIKESVVEESKKSMVSGEASWQVV